MAFSFQVFIRGIFLEEQKDGRTIIKQNKTKRLLEIPMDLEDLSNIDPERYNSIQWMLEHSISGILFETFSVETESLGVKKIHELKPGFPLDIGFNCWQQS